MIKVVIQLATALLGISAHAAPTVTISEPHATIVGASANGVDSFSGIPFAQPPVGNLRLRPPKPIKTGLGEVVATSKPQKCPQYVKSSASSTSSRATSLAPEDCLTLDIQRPSTAHQSSGLPVMFWIYGGGFMNGGTTKYDGADIIKTSVSKGNPVMYVAVNYRLGGFGFMPGKEVLDAGVANIGLLDQRAGLEWVAENIAAFGGDPDKVTIFGESAGSISVFNQMALYKGNNKYKDKSLFRAAIMDSGSIIPANPVDCPKGQAVYNQVVQLSGCSSANNTLECLRGLPFTKFQAAADSLPSIKAYSSVALSYIPRPDGVVLANSTELLVKNGQIAKVPFIVGDQEDEGTNFAQSQRNISTNPEVVDYFSSIFFPDVPRSRVRGLVRTYPNNPADGSPFRTGDKNNIYPEYKHLAAIIGDITFTLARRVFLTYAAAANPDIPSWSYLSSYYHGTPVFGTSHGTDVRQVFGFKKKIGFVSDSVQSYYLSFVHTLDPNTQSGGLTHWPRWSKNHDLLWFLKSSNSILADDFRNASFAYLLDEKKVLRV